MPLKYAKMQTHCFSLSFEVLKQSLNILKLLSNPKLCLKSTCYTLLIDRFLIIFTNILNNSILFYHKFSGYLVNIKNIPVLMGVMNLKSTPLDQYYSFGQLLIVRALLSINNTVLGQPLIVRALLSINITVLGQLLIVRTLLSINITVLG